MCDASNPQFYSLLSYKDTKKLLANLKPVFTAPKEDAALSTLDDFEKHGEPGTLWLFSPGGATGATSILPKSASYLYRQYESYNRQLRKVTQGKAVFPNDESLLKMLPQLGPDFSPAIRLFPRQGQ